MMGVPEDKSSYGQLIANLIDARAVCAGTLPRQITELLSTMGALAKMAAADLVRGTHGGSHAMRLGRDIAHNLIGLMESVENKT